MISAVGGRLATLTVRWVVADRPSPSVTVSRTVNVPVEVNVYGAVCPVRVATVVVPLRTVQAYCRVWPASMSGSVVPVPDRVTGKPRSTPESAPMSGTGARLSLTTTVSVEVSPRASVTVSVTVRVNGPTELAGGAANVLVAVVLVPAGPVTTGEPSPKSHWYTSPAGPSSSVVPALSKVTV